MKWSSIKNLSLILILIFFIVRLTTLMWNSLFYTTPDEKMVNVVKGWGIFLVCLGSMFIVTYMNGKGLRGEISPRILPPEISPRKMVQKESGVKYLVVINYILWIIIWETLELFDTYLHYFTMVFGLLIITIIWFWWDALKNFWWKILE